MRTNCRGQALMEMAVGMLAITLVVCSLCLFVNYIARSLVIQNALRDSGSTNSKSDFVEVDDFSKSHFVGASTLKISERVVMPERSILK